MPTPLVYVHDNIVQAFITVNKLLKLCLIIVKLTYNCSCELYAKNIVQQAQKDSDFGSSRIKTVRRDNEQVC